MACPRFGAALLLIIVAFSAMGNSCCRGQPSGKARKNSTISVMGSATMSATPDVGKVFLSVSVNRDAVAAACSLASTTTQAVADAVKRLNGDIEVSTSNLSIQPNINWRPDGQQQTNGYTCSNSLTVKVTSGNDAELAATIGAAVDAAIQAGGDYLTVSSMAAELSPQLRRSATNQARQQAVQDGASIASTLAEAAGVKLGPIKTISDTNVAPQPMPYQAGNGREAMAMAKVDGASSTPISVAAQDVTAAVEMVYVFRS